MFELLKSEIKKCPNAKIRIDKKNEQCTIRDIFGSINDIKIEHLKSDCYHLLTKICAEKIKRDWCFYRFVFGCKNYSFEESFSDEQSLVDYIKVKYYDPEDYLEFI